VRECACWKLGPLPGAVSGHKVHHAAFGRRRGLYLYLLYMMDLIRAFKLLNMVNVGPEQTMWTYMSLDLLSKC
jgi:hypothetical protein